jgi:hypothetical protein
LKVESQRSNVEEPQTTPVSPHTSGNCNITLANAGIAVLTINP